VPNDSYTLQSVPLSFPGTIQSVASYPGGVSGSSVPVSISAIAYGVPYCTV
jgi:hypothetical protein